MCRFEHLITGLDELGVLRDGDDPSDAALAADLPAAEPCASLLSFDFGLVALFFREPVFNLVLDEL